MNSTVGVICVIAWLAVGFSFYVDSPIMAFSGTIIGSLAAIRCAVYRKV